jgi:uncharacterized protein YkwD
MPKRPTARLVLLAVVLSSACALPPRAPTPIFPMGARETPESSPTPFLPPFTSPATSDSAWQLTASPQPLGGTLPAAATPCSASEPCALAAPSQTPSQATAGAYARRLALVPKALEVLEGLNRERQALGLPLLEAPPVLSDIAFVRAEDMMTRDYLGHEDPADGSTLAWSLAVAAGYGGRLAEALFATTGPLDEAAASALATWLASPENRAVLLDPVFRYAGAGLTGDGTWWKVVLLLAEQAPGPR